MNRREKLSDELRITRLEDTVKQLIAEVHGVIGTHAATRLMDMIHEPLATPLTQQERAE